MMQGPLRVNPVNPRYFTDDSGKAIYLTGMHVHGAFRGMAPKGGAAGAPGFDSVDYDAFLNEMVQRNHNFLRFWVGRETGFQKSRVGDEILYADPFIYVDINEDDHLGVGHPVYDLDQLNPAFFDLLREKCLKAQEKGIYTAIMLFEGWSLDTRKSVADGWPFLGHPFNKANNINGIDGNPPMDEGESPVSDSQDVNKFCPTEHLRVHTLDIPEITAYQKKYVKKVIETVNDLDNILYEICNEGLRWSRYFQYEMVDYIHEVEASMPKQHPVWMSHLVPAQNESLYVSNAEAISPGVEDVAEDYCINPPASDGRKVIIPDTDHLGGFWGTSQWVWKSFLRGLNPIFMDFWGPVRNMGAHADGEAMSNLFGRNQYMLPANWGEPVRVALGRAKRIADRMDLNHMLPYGELCSTGYVLANPGKEYLIYAPEAGQFRLKLYGAPGPFEVRWYNPNTDVTIEGMDMIGDGAVDITPPYLGEVLLYLKKR